MKRAHHLNLSLGGTTGPHNHLCDVPGIEIGHTQIKNPNSSQKGPGILTGVSVIFSKPKGSKSYTVPAGAFVFNGNGEVTGLSHIEEAGTLEGPIGLTGTFSVGTVSQALRTWMRKKYPELDHKDIFMGLPVVAETYDGFLHNVDSDALKDTHVFEALENATAQNTSEGDIGGGSGMMSFGFKSGIGSASRIVECGGKQFTLGALVQSNFGKREDLKILGRNYGHELKNQKLANFVKNKDGSLIVVLATNAQLSSRQLKRLAKRASLAMSHLGAVGRHSSGDFFLAFSTEAPQTDTQGFETWKTPADAQLDPFFEAAVQATQESILNALLSSQDTSSGTRKIYALGSDIFSI